MGRHAATSPRGPASPAGPPMILVPEEPFDIDEVCAGLIAPPRPGPLRVDRGGGRGRRARSRARLTLPEPEVDEFGHVSASAASATLLAAEIEERTGFETRVTVLGHIQRGGTPTAVRPGARHPLRGGGHRGGARRRVRARWWPSRPARSSGCRWPRRSAELKSVDPELSTTSARSSSPELARASGPSSVSVRWRRRVLWSSPSLTASVAPDDPRRRPGTGPRSTPVSSVTVSTTWA